jgi:peptide/nickel transport system permease protein
MTIAADPGAADQNAAGQPALDTGPVDTSETALVAGAEPEPKTQWQLFRRRFFHHKLALFGLFVLLVLCVCCFGARWIAPYENKPDLTILNAFGPRRGHWLGVDLVGRDFLTTNLYAGQVSLKIGLAVAFIATVFGSLTGAIAGYFGGFLDQILMRFTDMFLLLPAIAMLAIAIKAFGQSILSIVMVLSALGWMGIARIVRGLTLSLKEKEFIESARSIGCSHWRIILRHLLPNMVGPIMVNASLAVAGAIVAESTLSFLGFGISPPNTSWGKLLADGKESIATQPFLIYFPGMFIILTTLAVNFVGDGLRDAFDAQAKQ